MSCQFAFVGEKRSPRAIKLGVHWHHGRLSGKTLFDALRECGVDPTAEVYLNLFREAPGHTIDPAALRRIRALASAGVLIVAMGCKVQVALVRAGVGHLPLVHPAARGVIRTRTAYQGHVAAVLGPHLGRAGTPTAA